MALVDNLIYMITPANEAVASGSVLPLTTIARRTGRILNSNGNSIMVLAPGYYKVDFNATFTSPSTGDVEIKLQRNSEDVPGIVSSTTISTANTEVRTLSFSGIVRVFNCGGPVSLTLLNSGIAIDTTNISLSVEYLG